MILSGGESGGLVNSAERTSLLGIYYEDIREKSSARANKKNSKKHILYLSM